MNDWASFVAVIGLWAVVVVRWRRLIQPGPERYLLITFLGLSVTALAGVLPIYRAADEALPTGAAAAIRDVLVMVAAVALANFVATVENNGDAVGDVNAHRRRRVHIVGGALLGLISITPWLVGQPRSVSPSLAGIPDWFDTTWRTPVHVLPVVAATSYVVVIATASAWNSAGPQRGPMRPALYIIAVGAALSAPFVALKALSVVFWLTGHGPATIHWVVRVESLGQAVSLGLVGIGGSCVLVLHQRRRTVAAELLPQLDELMEETPLYRRTGIASSAPDDLDHRTVAINDLFFELTGYGRNQVRQHVLDRALAAGHRVEVAIDMADAAWLADALNARNRNDRQVTPSDSPYCPEDPHAAAVRLARIATEWTKLRSPNAVRADSGLRMA